MLLLNLGRYLRRIQKRKISNGCVLGALLKKRDIYYGVFMYEHIPKRKSVFVTCYEYCGLCLKPNISFWEITVAEWTKLGGVPFQGFTIERSRTPESLDKRQSRLPGHVDEYCERFEMVNLAERWFR